MDFLVRVQVLRKHALGIAGGLENLNLSCQIVKKIWMEYVGWKITKDEIDG